MGEKIEDTGWCAPSEVLYGRRYAPKMPQVTVPKGGMRFPRFAVETFVSSHKRFLRRREWRVHVRYHDGRPMHHYMEFTDESSARNAEQIVKFTMQWVNRLYWDEKA